jgi:SAM-dependent methyltransferase
MPDLRAFARRLARPLGRRRGREWGIPDGSIRGRREALREETDYWDRWLSTKGGKWAHDYRYRVDPSAEVADPALRLILQSLPQDRIAILDVGAGPVSAVGYRFPGKALALTAVDPLADEYDRLLAAHRLAPPVRTEPVEGEKLLERFGAERFDVAYARNALDHASDPLVIVENMLGVVSSRGYVVLRHVRNEGLRQGYVQLHQWNFDEREGRLLVWRPDEETDLTEMLAGRAKVECALEPSEEGEPDYWVVCTMRKLRGAA